MEQRINDESLADLVKYVSRPNMDTNQEDRQVKQLALNLQDARAQLAETLKCLGVTLDQVSETKAALDSIGEALGPWDWATYSDLVELTKTKMAKLATLEQANKGMMEALHEIAFAYGSDDKTVCTLQSIAKDAIATPKGQP